MKMNTSKGNAMPIATAALAVWLSLGPLGCDFKPNLRQVQELNQRNKLGLVLEDEKRVAKVMRDIGMSGDEISAEAGVALYSISIRCSTLPQFEGKEISASDVAYIVMKNAGKIVFMGSLGHDGKSDREMSALDSWQNIHPISNLHIVREDTERYWQETKIVDAALDKAVNGAKTPKAKHKAEQERTIVQLFNWELYGHDGNRAKYDLYRCSFANQPDF